MRADKRTHLSIEAVNLSLNMNDAGGAGICILSQSYSRVFTEDDISNTNAEKGKFKLIHRKRNVVTIVTF
jgi:hypothetical protein